MTSEKEREGPESLGLPGDHRDGRVVRGVRRI